MKLRSVCACCGERRTDASDTVLKEKTAAASFLLESSASSSSFSSEVSPDTTNHREAGGSGVRSGRYRGVHEKEREGKE